VYFLVKKSVYFKTTKQKLSGELSQGLAVKLSLDLQKQCCSMAFIIAKVAKWWNLNSSIRGWI
jgi:hypothetical protein